MPNKFEKLTRLTRLLEQTDSGYTLEQLGLALNVHTRTVKRYIQELKDSGLTICDRRYASNQPARYFCYRSNINSLVVPELEKIKRDLSSWGNPKFQNMLSQIISLLSQPSPTRDNLFTSTPSDISNQVFHVDHGPFAQQEVNSRLIDIFEKAISRHQKLRITYSSYKNKYRTFLFFPYCISLKSGTLYLIGKEQNNESDFLSLAVKRINRCISTGHTFQPTPFDPKMFYKYCFGQFPAQSREKPQVLYLAIHSDWLKQYLDESHFNPPGRWTRYNGQSCYQLEMVIKPDLINWMLSLMPHMTPLAPAALVSAVTERLALSSHRMREQFRHNKN